MPSYLDPDLLSRLDGLRLVPRRAQRGNVSGGLASPVMRGASMEFVDYKAYTPGDDLRRIDWKVYGRRDRYYLRSYEGETNYTLWIVLDASRSMTFRGPGSASDKWGYACRAALGLAYLALKSHDACGLALFADGLVSLVEARASWENLSRSVEVLDNFHDFGERTDYAKSWAGLAERTGRSSLVAVFSDFLGEGSEQVALAMEALALRRHEILAFRILDPFEEELGIASGLARVSSLETETAPPLEMEWSQVR